MTVINIGNISRNNVIGNNFRTALNLAVAANATGILNAVRIYLRTGYTYTYLQIGVFYGSGLNWTSRDSVIIPGPIVGDNAIHTYSSSIQVQIGDIIGEYHEGGELAGSSGGSSDLLYKNGNFFGLGVQTYAKFGSGYSETLDGIGSTILPDIAELQFTGQDIRVGGF